jgi:hypothetical protein
MSENSFRRTNYSVIRGRTKKVAGTLVPRINVENVTELGFVLEYIYFVRYNYSFIETILSVFQLPKACR